MPGSPPALLAATAQTPPAADRPRPAGRTAAGQQLRHPLHPVQAQAGAGLPLGMGRPVVLLEQALRVWHTRLAHRVGHLQQKPRPAQRRLTCAPTAGTAALTVCSGAACRRQSEPHLGAFWRVLPGRCSAGCAPSGTTAARLPRLAAGPPAPSGCGGPLIQCSPSRPAVGPHRAAGYAPSARLLNLVSVHTAFQHRVNPLNGVLDEAQLLFRQADSARRGRTRRAHRPAGPWTGFGWQS